MNGKLKIKSRMRAVRRVAACAMLLALLWPGAKAHGQTDNFFYINESPRDGGGSSGTWNGLGMSGDGTWDIFDFEGDGTETGATWTGFEYGDPLPTGAGLLALTVSGLCYAGLKRRKIQ